MKIVKKLLAFLVAVVLIFTIPGTAMAATTGESLPITMGKSSLAVYSYEELATFPKDKAYTYEEILADMQRSGSSQEEISNFVASHTENQAKVASTVEIRYGQFRMDTYTVVHTTMLGLVLHVHTFQPMFVVGLEYINNSYSPNRIVSLENAHIYTGDGDPCIFGGSIFYRLEAGNRFYYNVYGDTYETGTTTYSAGLKVGLGEGSTATFGVTYSNNYIANIDFDGRYISAGLSE
ncbi:hypothetical protein HNQ56_000596 [Anaerotaenia torta]|uniref:hypothetical protein n=1 Tax=Anaerotaenia torta TaxID=433293 RepID=UPI003D2413C9